jgi:hypothetical protein
MDVSSLADEPPQDDNREYEFFPNISGLIRVCGSGPSLPLVQRQHRARDLAH